MYIYIHIKNIYIYITCIVMVEIEEPKHHRASVTTSGTLPPKRVLDLSKASVSDLFPGPKWPTCAENLSALFADSVTPPAYGSSSPSP